MLKIKNKNQQGIGLIEVLVALILLAIAVLGYVALQTKAIAASQESVVKTQAQAVMKSLAENIRTNNASRALYTTKVTQYLDSTTVPTNCKTSLCTSSELVNYDAYSAKQYANNFGLKLGMADCPGVKAGSTLIRQCVFAAWGKTELKQSAGVLDYSKCMDASNGVYVSNASCLMMELY